MYFSIRSIRLLLPELLKERQFVGGTVTEMNDLGSVCFKVEEQSFTLLRQPNINWAQKTTKTRGLNKVVREVQSYHAGQSSLVYSRDLLQMHPRDSQRKDYKVLFEQILPILLPCWRNAICWRNASKSTVHRHSETLSESEFNAIGSSLIPSTPRVLLVNTHRISNHMSTSSSPSAFNLLEQQGHLLWIVSRTIVLHLLNSFHRFSKDRWYAFCQILARITCSIMICGCKNTQPVSTQSLAGSISYTHRLKSLNYGSNIILKFCPGLVRNFYALWVAQGQAVWAGKKVNNISLR